MWLFHLFLLSVMLLSCSACISEHDSPAFSIPDGAEVPEFYVTLNDGSLFSSSQLNGKTAVIVFFNTSCSDCREELPVLNRLHSVMPEIPVVCIARNEGRETIEKFWLENNLTLPFAPAESYPYSLFASSVIPRIYITRSSSPAVKARIIKQFSDSPLPSFETLTDALH